MSKLFGALYSPINQLDPNAQYDGEIRPYQQTWGEALQDGVRNAYTALGASQGLANRHSQAVRDLVEWTPYQSVMDVADYAQGNGSALDAGIGAMDFVPGIGQGVSMAAKKIFAGAKAAERLGKLDAMRKAEKMLGDGRAPEYVWRQTGFMRGEDGLMRFEIPDNQAEWSLDKVRKEGMDFYKNIHGLDESEAFKATEIGMGGEMQDILKHDELYKAYPELASGHTVIKSFDDGSRGSFHPKSGDISISRNLLPDDAKSTHLHEVQHAIQRLEDFDNGFNPGLSENARYFANLTNNRTIENLDDYENAMMFDKTELSTKRSKLHQANLYRNYQKLIDYANHPNPTSLNRHIRGFETYLHSDEFRDLDEAKELYRRTYTMPKKHRPKQERAEWLRNYAFDLAQLMRKGIDDNMFKTFNGDTRSTNGMIKAYERDYDKKIKELEPLFDYRRHQKKVEGINDFMKKADDFDVYQSSHGEAEARTVQSRMNLSNEELKYSYPGHDKEMQKGVLWTREMIGM
jgi:hypothetical protein